MTAIHWHRRDLRVADNRGLAAAADPGPAIPAFVFDPDVLDYASPPRVAFMLDALRSLRDAYRERGSDLVVARGDPRGELPRIAAAHGADRVVRNADFSGVARERDAGVRDTLAEEDIESEVHRDALLCEPGSILTTEGERYSVFSYFYRKWADRPKADPVSGPANLAAVGGYPIPGLDDLGFDSPDADVPPAGTDAARARLSAFLDGPVYGYDEDRDYPARGSTSRLSPHLRFGTVGIREVWTETGNALAGATEAEREGVEAFRRQLAFREFYAHLLDANPDLVAADFRGYENPIPWRDDPDGLRAWQAGETGYPIVDAGTRQLRREGYVHNRVRMIVASFLTKDLLIDWRRGYEHFRERLVDHDPANDAGGWQWAASTGPDAQPYFRVFNPSTQAERYDPDAEYVREYVPELRGVPASAIHGWPGLDPERRAELAPDYPEPIVEHADARERALEAFERARGD